MPKELILVTGGAGFVGSHLVGRLLQEGYAVRILDTLAPPVHNRKVPSWVNKKATVIKGDVSQKNDWVKALHGVSFVFHLAGYMDFHFDFSNYFRVNTNSTALLFEVIREKKYPVKKIIAASSQAIYGEGKYHCSKHGIVYPPPRSEAQLKAGQWEVVCSHDGKKMTPLPSIEDDQLVPVNPYGISKKSMEEILHCLGRYLAIPTVALRYCIVHGPRQTFRHFYSGALRQLSVMALTGGKMSLHEDAGQLRDFVHIDDVVNAHLCVLRNAKANYESYTVGSGRATRVLDLAKTVAQVLKIPFVYETTGLYRILTARHSLADVSKLKKLGWKPQKKLIDNVRDFIQWIQEYPEAQKYLDNTLKKLEKEKVVLKSL